MCDEKAGSTPEAYLYIQRGSLAGKILTLQPGINEFGRESDFILPDEHVSRRHAQITFNAGEFILTDLQSSNGTLLNGQQVTAPVKLQNGDVIKLGGTIMSFFIRGIPADVVLGTGALTEAPQPNSPSQTSILTQKIPKTDQLK